MKCPRCGREMISAENLFVCPDCQMVLKQVVPNATEVKDAGRVESDEVKRHAEEQKAREEAERIARDEAINAEINELKSQLSTLKKQVSAKKKEISAKSKQLSSKAQNNNKTRLVNVIRDSVILAVCIVLFALSFCSVSTVKADELLANNAGGVQIEGANIGLSSVDCITFMIYASKSYETESDVDERVITEMEEAMQELQEHISVSASGKITVDKKGNTVLHKLVVITMKVEAGLAELDGTSDEASLIATGVVALAYILFASAMLIVAFINFLFTLLNKNTSLNKSAMAMIPAYLIFAILLIFMCSGLAFKLGGAMIATIIICVFAIAAIIAYAVIFAKKGTRLALIPKYVSALIVVIVMACAFAPAFTARALIAPIGSPNRTPEYSYEFSLDVLGELIVRDDVNVSELSVRDLVETYLTDEAFSRTELKSEMANVIAAKIFVGCMQDYEHYKEISALSIGYWLMILVGVAGSISVGAIFAVSNGKKAGGLDLSMKILMVICIMGILACCIIGLTLAKETLNNYYGISEARASFGLGGGVITMLIFSILAIVNDGVSKAILKRAKKNDETGLVGMAEPSQFVVPIQTNTSEQTINNGENVVNEEI